MIRRTWLDIGWVAILTPHSHWVDVQAWEVVGDEDGRPLVGDGEDGFTTDWETLTPAIDGAIKWDGCSNLTMGDRDENCAWHHCDRADLVRVGEVLGRLFDVAMLLMGEAADEPGVDWPDTAEAP